MFTVAAIAHLLFRDSWMSHDKDGPCLPQTNREAGLPFLDRPQPFRFVAGKQFPVGQGCHPHLVPPESHDSDPLTNRPAAAADFNCLYPATYSMTLSGTFITNRLSLPCFRTVSSGSPVSAAMSFIVSLHNRAFIKPLSCIRHAVSLHLSGFSHHTTAPSTTFSRKFRHVRQFFQRLLCIRQRMLCVFDVGFLLHRS
jgi:hypothetical protein